MSSPSQTNSLPNPGPGDNTSSQPAAPNDSTESVEFKAFLAGVHPTPPAVDAKNDVEAEVRNLALTGVMYDEDGKRVVFPDPPADDSPTDDSDQDDGPIPRSDPYHAYAAALERAIESGEEMFTHFTKV